MKRTFISIWFSLLSASALTAQTTADTSVAKPADQKFLKRQSVDTSAQKMNMDAVYNRPFLQLAKAPVALGGYLEANSSYMVTDGITDGLSFQFQRLTLFAAASINKRLR